MIQRYRIWALLNETFDSTSEEVRFGCQIFEIRRTADRIEKSNPKNKANWNEFTTFIRQNAHV